MSKYTNLQQIKKIEKCLIALHNQDDYTLIKLTLENITLKCNNCSKKFLIPVTNFNRNKFSCGNHTCALKRHKQTNLEKYGVEHAMQSEQVQKKAKQTNLKKYGVEYTGQAKQVKDKIKITFDIKYGGYPFKNPIIQQKAKQTKINLYGSVNNINKIKQTNLKKYGVENVSQSTYLQNNKKKKYFLNKIDILEKDFNLQALFKFDEFANIKETYKFKCLKCNTIFNSNLRKIPRCPKCYPKLSGTSNIEQKLQEWIKTLNIKNYNFNKKFNTTKQRQYKYELDVYIPEFNLGIELDGIYWHSELQGKDKNYHLNKSKWFKDKHNIDVIHIFENEWREKQNIIKSIIKSKLGLNKVIYAKATVIKEITVNEAREFSDNNHLQGFTRAKYHYGLYYNNELVSYMSLGKSRFNKSYDYELIRFANKIDYNIVGGFSKLLKRFRTNHQGSIVSYVNKRLFNGQGYIKNGFVYINDSNPNYFYFHKNDYLNLYSRQQFQKHKLNKKLKDFNENLTEWENMQLNGYNRIFDCGNMIMFKA